MMVGKVVKYKLKGAVAYQGCYRSEKSGSYPPYQWQ